MDYLYMLLDRVDEGGLFPGLIYLLSFIWFTWLFSTFASIFITLFRNLLFPKKDIYQKKHDTVVY